MAVQGRQFDWESLQILVSGLPITNIKSIDWSDTRGVSPVFGAGGAPIGWGRRNYRGQGSMEVADESYRQLINVFSGLGGIYSAGFDVLLNYGNNPFSAGYKEDRHLVTMAHCRISRRGGASRQGAAEARIIRLEFEILGGINEFGANLLGKL